MRRFIKYLFVVLVVLLIVALYILKLYNMGISIKITVIFIIFFFAAAIIGYGVFMLLTKGLRKKLDKEFK